MAKKENRFEGYDIATQAVHTGPGYDTETGAVRRPLHMANSYKLPDDLSKVNHSSTDLLMYARNGNPNQQQIGPENSGLVREQSPCYLSSSFTLTTASL